MVLLASFGEELLKVWVVCPQDVRVNLLVYLVAELILDQSLKLILCRRSVDDQLGPARQNPTFQYGPKCFNRSVELTRVRRNELRLAKLVHDGSSVWTFVGREVI